MTKRTNHADLPRDDAKLDSVKSKRELAEAFCATGDEAANDGDFDDAFDKYQRALKLDPNSARARVGLGRRGSNLRNIVARSTRPIARSLFVTTTRPRSSSAGTRLDC